MNRLKGPTVAAVTALVLAACSSASVTPTWTYSPASPPTGATIEPTEVAATPTLAPTPAPTPTPTAEPALGTVDAPRVIEVTMGNFLYEPASVSVSRGETIRFVVHNPTTIEHELVLGTAEEQEHHAKEMAEGMDHHGMGDEPNEIEVAAGETAELVWTFDEPGEILMGCHVAGHWDAGMQGTIDVT